MKHKHKPTLCILNDFRNPPHNIEKKSFTMVSHIQLLIIKKNVLGNCHFYIPVVILAMT